MMLDSPVNFVPPTVEAKETLHNPSTISAAAAKGIYPGQVRQVGCEGTNLLEGKQGHGQNMVSKHRAQEGWP